MRVLAKHQSVSDRFSLGATLRAVKRLLLRRSVITFEIVGLTLAGIVGASLPQLGIASGEDMVRLYQSGPVLSALVELLSLDDVFQSPWFLGLTLLTAASLTIVVVEQFRRLGRAWSQPLTSADLHDAPYRIEFERVRRDCAAAADQPAEHVEMRSTGRLGLAGSPLFHAGLLLIMAAGALRALFGVNAMVDLLEGETLPPVAEAWGAQWPAAAANPLRLDVPLTLESVTVKRYASGALRDVRAVLSLDTEDGAVRKTVAINHEVQAPGGRLFLGADVGPTALIEWQQSGAEPLREAVMLRSLGTGTYQKAFYLEGYIKVFLRADVDLDGNHPDFLDVRIVDNERRALLFGGPLRAGDSVSLGDGRTFTLHGLPFWTRLRASRDPSLWPAYLGFALALLGIAILYTVVKVDTCVVITPEGDRERVFVALRAQRFAPMYRERFERMVRAQGGTV